MVVCVSVDVEPDCPPFLHTFRGIEEGMGRLLELLEQENVKATFFTTGEVAVKYPETVRKIVSLGHELGSHGFTHQDFTTMDQRTAEHEIRASLETLSEFAPVISFRAPQLRFPYSYLRLLEAAGFLIDSSQAKYKISYYQTPWSTSLTRVPVSVTSSVLRLPKWIRVPYLSALSSPAVLYVHPWEFVDLRKEKLRLDCRFKTGTAALDCLRSVLAFFKGRDANFLKIEDLVTDHGGV